MIPAGCWYAFITLLQNPAYMKKNVSTPTVFIKTVISGFLLCSSIILGCKTHYETTKETYTLQAGESNIAHGKNLAYIVCAQCHYDRTAGDFRGEEMKDLPDIMGKVYSADLRKGGILEDYTDAGIAYLLKTGISKDGRFIPYMVRPTMADQDINDIIAFLRSDDPALRGNGPSAGKTKLSALGKMAINFSGKPLDYKKDIPQPDKKDKLAYGYYLVDIIGCYHCHSHSILGLDYEHPDQSKGYMQGGMKWKIDRKKVYASNLTPDKRTGTGKYDLASFTKAVRDKIALDGRKLQYPMRKYTHLTDEQVAAIFAYLQWLPAKEHEIKQHPVY